MFFSSLFLYFTDLSRLWVLWFPLPLTVSLVVAVDGIACSCRCRRYHTQALWLLLLTFNPLPPFLTVYGSNLCLITCVYGVPYLSWWSHLKLNLNAIDLVTGVRGVSLLSLQPELESRYPLYISSLTAFCLANHHIYSDEDLGPSQTCLTSLSESSCTLQQKIAGHDGSGLSPQILAVVHINECFFSVSLLDFIDQRLNFGSGKSSWLQHGNVGSQSICLKPLFASSESIDKLIHMSVDVKVKRSMLPNLNHPCLHTSVLGAYHTCYLSLCFSLPISVQPACGCVIPRLAWRHELKQPRLIYSEVYTSLFGAIFGVTPNVSSKAQYQSSSPTGTSTKPILLLCWNQSKLEDHSPLALSIPRKASQISSCQGHERSFSTFLCIAGVATSIKLSLHEKDSLLGCIANDHCRFSYRLLPCVMVRLGPEGTTILTPVRIEVSERSSSRYTVTISVEKFEGRCNLSGDFLVCGTFDQFFDLLSSLSKLVSLSLYCLERFQ